MSCNACNVTNGAALHELTAQDDLYHALLDKDKKRKHSGIHVLPITNFPSSMGDNEILRFTHFNAYRQSQFRLSSLRPLGFPYGFFP